MAESECPLCYQRHAQLQPPRMQDCIVNFRHLIARPVPPPQRTRRKRDG